MVKLFKLVDLWSVGYTEAHARLVRRLCTNSGCETDLDETTRAWSVAYAVFPSLKACS